MAEVSTLIAPLIQALQRNTETYSEFADQLRGETGRGIQIPGRRGRESQDRLKVKETEHVRKSAESFKGLRDALDEMTTAQKLGQKMTTAHGDALRAAAQQVNDNAVKMTDEQKELLRAVDRITVTGRAAEGELQNLTAATEEAVAAQSELVDIHNAELAKQRMVTHSMDQLVDGIKKVSKNFFTLGSALTQISASLYLTVDHFTEAVQAQQYSYSMINEGLAGSAAAAKMSTDALNSSFIQHRKMILATAGDYSDQRTAGMKWRNMLDRMIPTMQDYVNKADDAGELLMDSSALFAKQAVKVSQEEIAEALPSFIDQMKTLTRLTGTQGKAIVAQLGGYLESADARKMLLQMDKRERSQYVMRLAQEAEYFAVQGKSIEQFMQVNEALSSLAGVDPKQRLKEAARITAVAGAMGMNVDPNVMRVMAKAPGSQTVDERNMLQNFATEFTKVTEEALGGNDGRMYAAGGLMSSIQGPMLSALQQMQTAGEAGLALSKEQAEAATKGTTILDGAAERINDIYQWLETTLTPYLKDPSTGIFTGLFTGFVSLIKDGMILALSSAAIATVFPGLVGAGLGLAVPVLVAGLGLALGGIIGTAIYKAYEAIIPDWMQGNFGDAIGPTIDGWLAPFSDEAAHRVEMADKAIEKMNNRPVDFYKAAGITNPADMAAIAKRQNELQAEGVEMQKAQAQALQEISAKVGATTKAVTEQGEKASEYEEGKIRNKQQVLVPAPGWVSPPP